MALTRNSIEKTAVRYGTFTAIASMLYFLAMKALGLIGRIEYSFFVGVILAVGICAALARYKRENQNRITYLSGIGVGFVTSLTSSVLFGAFVVIYSLIDKTFVEAMRTTDLFGVDLSITAVFFLGIVMQGISIGAFIGYVAMMYFKSPDHKPFSSRD